MYGHDVVVLGEWKDGQLDGRAVENWNEAEIEYEIKDGKINGKFIQYNNDGRLEIEYKEGN